MRIVRRRGHTSAWDDGEMRFGQSDRSRGSQHTEVCAETQLKAAAKGCAANGGDGGDWECRQTGESAPQLGQELGDAVRVVSVCLNHDHVYNQVYHISYSSGDMANRSFKSAPAQKALSDSLAKIKARVLPLPPSSCKPSTTPLSSLNSWVEIAFRALGRSSDRTVMVPACGAGMLEILRADLSPDAYDRCCCCWW